jgi:hypothetical protein
VLAAIAEREGAGERADEAEIQHFVAEFKADGFEASPEELAAQTDRQVIEARREAETETEAV